MVLFSIKLPIIGKDHKGSGMCLVKSIIRRGSSKRKRVPWERKAKEHMVAVLLIVTILPDLILSDLWRKLYYQVVCIYLSLGLDSANKVSKRPSAPLFSRDLKTAPWRNGRGSENDYSKPVSDWCSFHSLLPDIYSNKWVKRLWGPLRKPQCCGKANDLVRSVPKEKSYSDSVAQYIVTAIHKHDLLSFISNVFSDFNDFCQLNGGIVKS